MKTVLPNYFPHLAPGEVAALRDLLRGLVQHTPYAEGYDPTVIGGRFHEDDCRQQLFEKAAADGYALSQAVCGYVQKRRWPRMTKSARFFLRPRLEAAVEYCRVWLRSYSIPANMEGTCLPPDVLQCVELLVQEHWGDTACRDWVADNAGQYIERTDDFQR